jgi:hypothetical protein
VTAAIREREHRAALEDFHISAVGGQSDFAHRGGASGTADFYVTKAPALVHSLCRTRSLQFSAGKFIVREFQFYGLQE